MCTSLTTRLASLLCMLLLGATGWAQPGKLSLLESGSPANNGAVLDLNASTSGDKGFLVPRMTEAERSAIGGVAGLQVFQTDGNAGMYYHNGTDWVQWTKPLSGNVEMGVSSSTVTRGEGFTVAHEELGRDLITLHTPYANIPMIIVGSEAIAGVPPVIPNDLCEMNLGTCANSHMKWVLIDYPIGGAFEFYTGTNNCQPAPGSRTSYAWGGPEWSTLPTSIAANTSFEFRCNTTTSNPQSVSIWVDWDQSGTFDLTEQVHSEGLSASIRYITIPVPATACNGYTALRAVVRPVSNHTQGCEVPDLQQGETEEVELLISGGADCSGTYQEKQVVCNVAGLTNSQFRVECSDLYGEKVDGKYHFKIINND